MVRMGRVFIGQDSFVLSSHFGWAMVSVVFCRSLNAWNAMEKVQNSKQMKHTQLMAGQNTRKGRAVKPYADSGYFRQGDRGPTKSMISD